MINLVVTYGLDAPADGLGNGLRAFIDTLTKAHPEISATFHSYLDNILTIVQKFDHSQPLIILGHSFGGGKSNELCIDLLPLGVKVDWLILLDPVPTKGWPPRLFNTTDFIVPSNVQNANCFLRNAGLIPPYSKPIRSGPGSDKNKYMSLSHVGFCDNREIEIYIQDICLKYL